MSKKEGGVSAATFKGVTKHGRFTFMPGIVYGFEDPDAVPYFVAAGWADPSNEDPAMIVTLEEIDIDPETVFAGGTNRGKKVMETLNG